MKKIREILSIFLCLTLILSQSAFVLASDIESHWAKTAIDYCVNKGYISGYGEGNYKPDDPISRAETAVVINKMMGLSQESSHPFVDIKTGIWYENAVATLYKKGIVSGISATEFGPDLKLTREAAAVLLSKAWNITGNADDIRFNDGDSISTWAKSAVQGMNQLGYINGYPDNTFKPQNTLKRAEICQIIYNYSQKNEQVEEKVPLALPNSGPALTLVAEPTSRTSGSVTIKVTAEDSEQVKYIGWRSSDSGATYTNMDGFTDITAEKEFSVNSNGWYAVGASDGQNNNSYKLIQITNIASSGGGGGGGGGGGSSNVNPSITVTTPFPTGTITVNRIDVTYSAIASTNATIAEVAYSINGGADEYIYLAGRNGITAKGTLGTGYVLLIPGENNIVFTAKDTVGKTATFTIVNKPSFDLGADLEYDNDYIADLSDGSGFRYVTNRIVIIAKDGVSEEQVSSVLGSINGIIVGKIGIIDQYFVQVPESTNTELEAICNSLLATYPELFEVVRLDIIDNTSIQVTSYTEDPWWGDDNQWGLTAIKAPEAWNEYSGYIRNIKIGVVDNGFRTTHEDLNIPRINVVNLDYGTDDHGTHVMGTIGAIHNNEKGLAGVIKTNRNSLFGYDAFSGDSGRGIGSGASREILLLGLTWNVVHGAKVINFSVGGRNMAAAHYLNSLYAPVIRKLVSHGYDFVIVNAAGNGWDHDDNNRTLNIPFNAANASIFAGMTNNAVAERTLVVGATDVNGNLAYFSNYGNRVDVVAPGVNIYSSVASSDSGYDSYDGTSMAAPHVSGVAAMVWAANPGLSGAQLKEIITDAANNYGLQVDDERNTVPEGDRRTYHQVNAKAAVELALGVSPELTTGRLTGQVIAATVDGSDGAAIANAHIALYSGINDPAITQTTSDVGGHYSIDNIATGRYYLEIAAEGYIPETFFVQIEAGVTTHINRLRAIPSSTSDGTIGGLVINAYTGGTVNSEITLDFRRGIDYNPDSPGDIAKSITTSSGTYQVTLPAGNYTVTARGEGYITTTSYVYSFGGVTINSQNVVISPEFSGGDSSIRFVLTWGELPSDLDSHLVGPTEDGESFHIYYENMTYHDNSIDTSSFNAILDVDDVSSFGPETVTINNLIDGTYDYYIQDYSHLSSTTSNYLRNSQAVIRIYNANNELLRTFNVPTGGSASTIWHVFKLEVINGEYSIVPINTMHNVPTSPSLVGNRGQNFAPLMVQVEDSIFLTDEEIEAKASAARDAGIVFEERPEPSIDQEVAEPQILEETVTESESDTSISSDEKNSSTDEKNPEVDATPVEVPIMEVEEVAEN